MIGDFHYVSSSSEDSNSEYDSDSGESDGGINKLHEERTRLEEKIKAYETKLGYIQRTLKSLNNERKVLLERRNQLIASVSGEEEVVTGETSTTGTSMEINEYDSSANAQTSFNFNNTNSEPLNLNVAPTIKSDDEEFDSEDDL